MVDLAIAAVAGWVCGSITTTIVIAIFVAGGK